MFAAEVTSSRVVNEIEYGAYREVATTSECLGHVEHFPFIACPSFGLNRKCAVCDITDSGGSMEKNSIFMMQKRVYDSYGKL